MIPQSERRRDLSALELERLRIGLGDGVSSVSASPLLGGIDTATYRLRADRRGRATDMVLRWYRGWDRERAAERVRREGALLDAISSRFIFAPRPLLIDPDGCLLGDPAIVLSWFPGKPTPPPRTSHLSVRSRWIADFAAPLVAIHTIGPDQLPAGFRRTESPEAELMNVARGVGTDALSRRLVDALHRSLPAEGNADPVLLHHDYWYGNTIWQDGRLAGVVDWSSARLGDPRNDLALARTDLAVTLDLKAADELVTCYERIRGPVSGLQFWDLLWALVAHRHMDDWLIGYRELGLPELSSEEAKAKIAEFAERALRTEDGVDRTSGR